MQNDEDPEVLSSIADFHSNRAVAHASFLIASIFGVFAILPLIETVVGKSPIALLFLSVAYWLLWIFGLYSFANFSYFASIAEVAQERIAARNPTTAPNIRRQARERQWYFLRGFYDLKRAGSLGRVKIPLILLIYILIGVLPFLAVVVF